MVWVDFSNGEWALDRNPSVLAISNRRDSGGNGSADIVVEPVWVSAVVVLRIGFRVVVVVVSRVVVVVVVVVVFIAAVLVRFWSVETLNRRFVLTITRVTQQDFEGTRFQMTRKGEMFISMRVFQDNRTTCLELVVVHHIVPRL